RAKQRKLWAVTHKHQPAHEHVKQKRRVTVINTEAVQSGIRIEALRVGGKSRENQKWNKEEKSGGPALGTKLGQQPEHQWGCHDQYGPLHKQQRLRFGKQGLSPREKIIAKRSDRCGEVQIGNLPHLYALC